MIGILLTCAKHWHNCILSLSRTHETSLTLSSFSDWIACTKPGGCVAMYLCVSGIDFAAVSTMFRFWNCFESVVFCFFILLDIMVFRETKHLSHTINSYDQHSWIIAKVGVKHQYINQSM
jgi:hypothetical protein